MSKSQETFLKKQREKERARKKREKREKRELKKSDDGGGIEIDWSSAPENKTLSPKEIEQKKENKNSSK